MSGSPHPWPSLWHSFDPSSVCPHLFWNCGGQSWTQHSMCSLTSTVKWDDHISLSSAPMNAPQDPHCLSSCSSALVSVCLLSAGSPGLLLARLFHGSWVLTWLGSLVLCSQVQDSALLLVELYTVLVAQFWSLFLSLKGGSPCQCMPLKTQFSDRASVVRVLLVPSSRSF